MSAGNFNNKKKICARFVSAIKNARGKGGVGEGDVCACKCFAQ